MEDEEDPVNPAELTVTVDRAVTTLCAIGKEHCNVTYLVLSLSFFLFFFPPPPLPQLPPSLIVIEDNKSFEKTTRHALACY